MSSMSPCTRKHKREKLYFIVVFLYQKIGHIDHRGMIENGLSIYFCVGVDVNFVHLFIFVFGECININLRTFYDAIMFLCSKGYPLQYF